MMKFDILGTTVEYDEELIFFVKKLFEFESIRDYLIKKATRSINNNEIISALEDTDATFKRNIRKIIAELSTYGIYDKIEDDFIGSNKGYEELINAFNNYTFNVNRITTEHNNEAIESIDREERMAKSQISGLDFGIITNDILSMWIYDSMNESKIRKETEKAQKKFGEALDNINSMRQINIARDTYKLRKDELLPTVNNAINHFYCILFQQYMAILSQIGKFDISCIKGIDEKRAVLLLDNLKVVDSPENLIINSIKLCPYRIQVYLVAERLGLITDEVFRCCKTFLLDKKLEEMILNTCLFNGAKTEKDVSINECYYKLKDHFSTLEKITGLNEKNYFRKIVSERVENITEQLNDMIKIFHNHVAEYRNNWFGENTSKNSKEGLQEEIISIISKTINERDYDCLIEHGEYDLSKNLKLDNPVKALTYRELQLLLLAEADKAIEDYLNRMLELEKREEQEYIKRQEKIKAKNKKNTIILVVIIIMLVSGIIINQTNAIGNLQDKSCYKKIVKQYGELFGDVKPGTLKCDVESKYKSHTGYYGYGEFYTYDILGQRGELEIEFKENSDGENVVTKLYWKSNDDLSYEIDEKLEKYIRYYSRKILGLKKYTEWNEDYISSSGHVRIKINTGSFECTKISISYSAQ